MAERLSSNPNERIDRSRPVTFHFEGKSYTGYAGDTITTALWANGVRILGRSFKYHRPRGILSLANHDVNVMVDDGETLNIRGDVTPIREGQNLTAVNTSGGVAKDRNRWVNNFSKLMPVGFYYKAFHTPKRLFPMWERRIREMAGLGTLNTAGTRTWADKRYDFCDVLVVGAGPSGLSAGIAAAQTGARTVVVDENPYAGGTLNFQGANDPVVAQRRAELLEQAEQTEGLEIRTGTMAAGYYSDHWVPLVDDQFLTKMRAGSVVVATGSWEQPTVFRNNDLPGVMLASAAQRLVQLYSVKPCKRLVVVAANADGYRAALDMAEAGVDVAGIADLREEGEGSDLADQVAKARIPIYKGHAVGEAHAGSDGTLSAVTLARFRTERPDDWSAGERIECDGLLMSTGWTPALNLLYQAGATVQYDPRVHQFVPASVPEGVFGAGRVNGQYVLSDKLTDGKRAGLAAAAQVGKAVEEVPQALEPQGPPPSHPYPILAHPKGKNFVDMDEDLHLKDYHNAAKEGFDNIELLKRYSTNGMGPSQGKHSNMNAVRILSRIRGEPIDQVGTTTARPYYHPVPFKHLAGRRFRAVRVSALHSKHKSMRADEFLRAGAWLRPAYYAGSGAGRDGAITAEVNQIRNAVGIIDVSPLGKIEVNGSDAPEFLDRFFTGKYSSLQVGRSSLCLQCDEAGVVTADGLVGRLAEDRFYVTVGTTHSSGVYQEMQQCAIEWGMSDLWMVNVTGQFAGLNLAGPYARRVLEGLTDVNLDEEQFPFPHFREGTIAGVRGRLLRSGFVGELSYEVHVPSQWAQHVLDRLLEAGAPYGIQACGLEAQRVLRLEKGINIVGVDSDPLTDPFMLGMSWAVKMEKPFFIGQRSLQMLQDRPKERQLAGFSLPEGYSGALPKECNLVLDGNEITGRVTSIAHSPTLGKPIGLCYLAPHQAEPGTQIPIKLGDGSRVTATVESIPFYDPKNTRQKVDPEPLSGGATEAVTQ
ncbi:2Fe-2S iron-sulfur cluster-binding protein [Thiohalorhabdus sp. Cl-TMA]|uniref:2Fe-2S iron-sulfur cluster-binding protein n=1 Tax=Thiohalorhabdus methylotrophus TaxID=3242694 RepID=A0ABV4TX99_9GAMM